MDEAGRAFAALAERFAHVPGVEAGTGFGTSPGLRVDGKIFAMLPSGELVVKLPRARCEELVAAGEGSLLTNGRRTMREWLVVPGADESQWERLAAEALAYVRP